MTAEATQTPFTTKLFIGCQINSELRMHLNYSERWKQEQVIQAAQGPALEKVRYKDKDYVGLNFDNMLMGYDQIQTVVTQLRQTIGEFCPELNPDTLRFTAFSQLFLS